MVSVVSKNTGPMVLCKLSILRRCKGNYMQCTGVFVTPTCYFGHSCSYFMQMKPHL
jgi:hypothetical protein